MKKFIVLSLAFLASVVSFEGNAQQNIVYSQYIFNGLLINPAYAGSHVQLSSALSYRNQWVNFDGAPKTATFGIHSAFKKEKVGLGLLMTNDKIGSYSNTGAFLSYAYMLKMPFGKVLSFGVQGGFNNFEANYSDLKLRSSDNLFDGNFNEFKLNFGAGVFYYTKKMFAGLSVPTMFKTNILHSNNFNQLVLPRVYYLHAGTMISLNRMETFKISPSFLLRVQDGTPLSADFNINFIFYDLISLGHSYRTGDALVTFLSFKLSEKFHFIYSYDLTTSDVGSYSKGTHEFTITYRTRIRQVHKDVECPYFYSH